MFVENVKGSSKISEAPPYPYNSWLNYWEKNSGQIFIPKKCPACGRIVTRKELDGCHVKKQIIHLMVDGILFHYVTDATIVQKNLILVIFH